MNELQKVEIKDKINLTVEEAAALTNIGKAKIYELVKEKDCDFSLQIGKKILIKREPFTKYLMRKSVL